MPSSEWFFVVIPSIILLHLIISPYTKVEESFNVQAIHDILRYGIPISHSFHKLSVLFDHMTFSGAVPRTFLGAVTVAGLSKPLVWLGSLYGLVEQSTVRAVLGVLNAAALIKYAISIKRAYGDQTAKWFLFFQAGQFHISYYATRTLPNMFAFCLSTFALSYLLPSSAAAADYVKRLRLAFYLLTLATVAFRSEMALLMASQAGVEILRAGSIGNAYSLIQRVFIPAVSIAALVGIFLSVSIDTFYWQSKKFLWPEMSAFWFNIFPQGHGGASAWGTSPWHWYFTSAIPRLFLGPTLLLIPYGLLFTSRKPQILSNLMPALGYTALYSILAHKETRFLFPIVPPLTLSTALSASYLSLRRDLLSRMLVTFLVATVTLTYFISHAVLLPLSAQNYPGGRALRALHLYHSALLENSIVDDATFKFTSQPEIKVHLTNLALQTGVTRFLEQPHPPPSMSSSRQILKGNCSITTPYTVNSTSTVCEADLVVASIPNDKPYWLYDKSSDPDEFLRPSFWSQIDYAIVEDPARVIGAWKIISEIPSLRRSRPWILRPDESRAPLVLGRNRDGPSSICPEWRGSVARIQRDDAYQHDGEPCVHVEDELYYLVRAMYGRRIAWIYALAHDVLREGSMTGRSLTGGYWLDWGLETRLFVLKRDLVAPSVPM